MIELIMVVLALMPLDVPSQPTPPATYPRQGPGGSVYIVGGFLGLGIIVLATVLLRFPKRANRRPFDQ
jgi:hypothetical protein